MKSIRMTLALTGALIAAVAYANQQQMNPNMPGMVGMAGMQHGTKAAEAHGVGVVRAIDTAQGTITLEHQAITSLGWPAMTMTFKVASPEVLKGVRWGKRCSSLSIRPAWRAR